MGTAMGHAREAASPGRVQAFASRTLDFLQTIERTIDRLQADEAVLRTIFGDIQAFKAEVAASESAGPIDPEGRTCELLTQAAGAAQRKYDVLVQRRTSALTHARVDADDGLVEAFSACIAALADVHNAIEDLRDTIETMDSLHSPVVGTFSNADDLIAALKH
ncbi:MAG TPA: hypothetical protein VD932_04725 [Aquabacterium sp.]|nr:hypothetical protein [Aquabacterium sp.]